MSNEPTNPDVAGIPGASSSVRGQAGVAEEVSATASELGRSARQKAERARTRAAAGLETAATSVHSGVDRAADAGHIAGDAISSTAQYVRDNDVREMLEDAMDVVRKNPGIALLGAVALGFLVGRALTRS
jgi:hypothetical protein